MPIRLALTLTLLLMSSCKKEATLAVPKLENGPGAVALPLEIQGRIHDAKQKLSKDHQFRTKHRDNEGNPLFSNRLFLESSPYLQQHAHNPVNWFPWGDEAFERAKALGRPVFLSVGYSTCHWCHVMEEESFEDLEIARYLNENYVAIKVDREERPDVDAIYMQAVRLLTRGGGWPMSVWLTQDREPFMGGTYFPARDGDRGRGKGFLTHLRDLRARFDKDPTTLAAEAQKISLAVQQSLAKKPSAHYDALSALNSAYGFYERSFDPEVGGLQRRRKFPSSLPIEFLLRESRRQGKANAQQMATLTLEKMSHGGIYDQIGGGFHRYTTDPKWQVPHFEKMLYDNALLVPAYISGYLRSGNPHFLKTARQTLDYVAREMTSPKGGFYSATDADSPISTGSSQREEGLFFIWSIDEVRAHLDAKSAALFIDRFGLTSQGNFEGHNILHITASVEALSQKHELSLVEVENRLAAASDLLYNLRLKRPPPLRDDKVLSAWNGLMISAFAKGARVTGDIGYLESAQNAAEHVLSSRDQQGRLRRVVGSKNQLAFLDDYAFMIAALLDLYETDGDARWLKDALALEKIVEEHYRDESGGYFRTASFHESLLVREKNASDNAVPAGNSVHAMNLLRLQALTTDDVYRVRAEALFSAFGTQLSRGPAALSQMLLALDFNAERTRQVVLALPDSPKDEELRAMTDAIVHTYSPNRVVVHVNSKNRAALSALTPLAAAKVPRNDMPTAYICENQVCELPETSPEKVRALLAKPRYLP